MPLFLGPWTGLPRISATWNGRIHDSWLYVLVIQIGQSHWFKWTHVCMTFDTLVMNGIQDRTKVNCCNINQTKNLKRTEYVLSYIGMAHDGYDMNISHYVICFTSNVQTAFLCVGHSLPYICVTFAVLILLDWPELISHNTPRPLLMFYATVVKTICVCRSNSKCIFCQLASGRVIRTYVALMDA